MAAVFNRDETELPEVIEANYQKYLVKVCMLIGIPVLSCFTIYDFIIGRYLIALVLAFMLLNLFGLFVITKKQESENRYRQAFEQLNPEKDGRQQSEQEFHQIESRFREIKENSMSKPLN